MKTEIIEDYFSNEQKIAEDNTQKEKIIVETKIEYNFEESIRKYYEEDNNQSIIQKILNLDRGPMSYVDGTLSDFIGLSLFGVGYLAYKYLKKKRKIKLN